MKSRLELKIVLKGEKLEVDRKERRLLQFGSPSLHTDVSPEETRPLPRPIMGRLTVNCLFFLGLFFVCVCVCLQCTGLMVNSRAVSHTETNLDFGF